MSDNDALIAEAREAVQSSMNGGVLGAPEWPISEYLVDRLADALESQKAVVDAAQEVEKFRLPGSWAKLRRALAALDAPDEGEG